MTLPSGPSLAPPSGFPAALVDVVRTRLAAGKTVRRTLPGGGRLHIDRPLPFLCLYRALADRPDLGTDELVRTQASYLIAPAVDGQRGDLAALVGGLVEVLADACGACLLLELWSGASADTGAPPRFLICTSAADRFATTIEALAEALRGMTLPATELGVDVVATNDPSPPGLPAVIPPDATQRAGCLMIGLEVPPLYRSPTGGLYPLVLRALARDLARALQQGFFEFTRVQTPARPEHYQMMGRRNLVRAVREADAVLAEISTSFDFLLDVTPVNTEVAYDEFCRGGRARAPTLRYRMLTIDPELGKRRLYNLPLERLEDPVLAFLLRDKRRELDRQLDLLEDRDSKRFLTGSLQLYGGVSDDLLGHATAILAALAAAVPAVAQAPRCDAHQFAVHARAELDRYRRAHPTLAAVVQLRDDIPDLMVSHGDLLVPRHLSLTAARAEAVLQHEVTHVVTYANGRSQPLKVFAAGLAGYEALQEGLALVAEHLAGGLDAERLHLIAARAVAVHRLCEGASFPAVVAELTDRHGLPVRAGFGIAIRVFRSGGLTKDAIYLRGLLQLLDHFAAGGAVEPLLVGKVALEQVPLVEELLRRQVLRPPPLRPRWLDAPGAEARLGHLRRGVGPLDLIEGGTTA
ncbi:MAG: flavohemoglobin expression-modulating QEGLA motif protein [Gammaproteobacteria bacterium]